MAMDRIRFGVYPGITARIIVAPLHIALRRGYFDQLDLELEIHEPPNHPWGSTAKGEIDIGLSFVDYCAWDGLFGNIVTVGLQEQFYADHGMTCLLARTALIDSGELNSDPASIAGKRIGLPGGRADDYLCFRGVLDQAGLTMDDVECTPAGHGGEDRATALVAGAVDIVIGRRPNGVASEIAKGHVKLWRSGDEIYSGLQARYFAANRTFLTERRDVVVRFLAGYTKGVNEALAAFDLGAKGDNSGFELLSELTGETVELLSSTKAIGWHPTAAIDRERLDTELVKMREAALFPAELGADDVVDFMVADEAAAIRERL